MSLEGQLRDQKSLRAVTGKTADWAELVKDCIAFANASGGQLQLGIEDGHTELPAVQRSGYDKIFEVLLSQGRPMPELVETHDRVQVTVWRRIHTPEVIDFIAKADQTYLLTQRECIALGLLAQHDALTARELAMCLELPTVEALQPWLKRLLDWQLLQSTGRTQATRYFIAPGLRRALNFNPATALKRIEPHRLAALVLEDLRRYPASAISAVHARVGGEIHPKQIKRAVDDLIERGAVRFEGSNRWRRYWSV